MPVGLTALVVPPLVTQGTNLAEDLPNYANDVQDYVNKNKRLRELDDKYDLTGQLQKQANQLPGKIGDAAKVLSDIGLGLVNSVFALVNILILSIFIVAGGRGWTEAALQLRPEAERERMRRILDHTACAVGGYVQGALTIALIAGVQAFIVMEILGVPFAAPLAVLAGLASLIPLVGATVAAIVIGLVTLFNDFPTDTIIWAVWAVIYQQIENNVIQPQVQRRTVQVQPIVVLVAVLFGSTLMGIVGAIVAIPLAASIQIALREWWAWRQEVKAAHADGPAARRRCRRRTTRAAAVVRADALGLDAQLGHQRARQAARADQAGADVRADDGADLRDEDRLGAEDLAAALDELLGLLAAPGCAGRPSRRRRPPCAP